ncbi:ClpP/crotonase-like domain-containing protein [Sporodiniella umbellata]|nr:ClpP/crotonase-like domain-containing protein [Sporodiniella umbellata]
MTVSYETVRVSYFPEDIAHVQLNRPDSLNALNLQMMVDIGNIQTYLLSGSGRGFTVGLDLSNSGLTTLADEEKDVARNVYQTRSLIRIIPDAFTAIEVCSKPVIAAIHNACLGAGASIITACDLRYCTKDAFISVKEIEVGLAADVGALQRLPKVIGNHSLVCELCYTARNVYAEESLQCGLVNKVTENYESLIEEVMKTARLIASKSPIAVLGTKHLLNYSQDHSVAEGLVYTVTWNSAMLQTEGIPHSIEAFVTKKPAVFSKL